MATNTPNGGIRRDRVRGTAAIAVLRMAKFIHWQSERPTGADPWQPSDSSNSAGGPAALWGTPGECRGEIEEPSGRKLRISRNGSAVGPLATVLPLLCDKEVAFGEDPLYRLKEWGMSIRLVGQPPIGGTR